MAHLLAFAGGAGFLWLICGLLPVQALSSLNIADENLGSDRDKASYTKTDYLIADKLNTEDFPLIDKQEKSEDAEAAKYY